MSVKYRDDSREISGMGGEYEESCRTMVIAGYTWLTETKLLEKPEFTEYKNIYGIIKAENDTAQQLEAVILAACEDCSGAMMQASINHSLAAYDMGWEKYQDEMKEEGNVPREG